MTTRHEAIERALATASETMHAKGEVQSMVIAHMPGAFMAFPLGVMMQSSETKNTRLA